MKTILNKIEQMEKRANSIGGQVELLTTQIVGLEHKLLTNENNKQVYTKAVEIMDLAQKYIRETIKQGFEGLVTNALQTVFGPDFIFQLEYGRRGNLQEIDFTIKRPDLQESVPILDTSAGGQVDIVTAALRIIILELVQRNNKSPLIMDEPFKHVSSEYLKATSEFLKSMNSKMERQVIFVTHEPELAQLADNTVNLNEKEN